MRIGLSLKEFLQNPSSYSLKDNKNIPLDHKLKLFLDHPYGFFIEVGAHDGISQSNTKIFEDLFGWNGLLIEPSFNQFMQCRKNRPYSIVEHYALVSSEYKKDTVIGDFDGHLMSSIRGTRLDRPDFSSEVPAITLSRLLDTHHISNIDFLSLDTEGYELAVLQGIDFKRHRPKFILIEIYAHFYNAIISILKSNDYSLINNFTNYNSHDNPFWDGTHNDFLFISMPLESRRI